MKKPPLVEVVWHDAHSVDEWSEEPDLTPREIKTTGYLVKETDKVLAIASSIDHAPPATYACVMVIPKVCILSKKRIAKPKG